MSVTLLRAAKVGGPHHLAIPTVDELVIHDCGRATDQLGEVHVNRTRQLAHPPRGRANPMPANMSPSHLFHTGSPTTRDDVNCGARGEDSSCTPQAVFERSRLPGHPPSPQCSGRRDWHFRNKGSLAAQSHAWSPHRRMAHATRECEHAARPRRRFTRRRSPRHVQA